MAASALHECLSVILPMSSLKIGMLVTIEKPSQACMQMSWSLASYLSLQQSVDVNRKGNKVWSLKQRLPVTDELFPRLGKDAPAGRQVDVTQLLGQIADNKLWT